MDIIETVFVRNNLIVAFAVVGVTIWISYFIADRFTAGRIHGSAIAITLGLIAAYFGGVTTGGSTGVADMALLGGIGTIRLLVRRGARGDHRNASRARQRRRLEVGSGGISHVSAIWRTPGGAGRRPPGSAWERRTRPVHAAAC